MNVLTGKLYKHVEKEEHLNDGTNGENVRTSG